MRPSLAPILAAVLLPWLVLAGCAGGPSRAAPCPQAPRRRDAGPRSIPFAGGDPAARGWVKVDDLLWIEAAHADAFRRGEILLDGRYVPFAEADAAPKSPEAGYVLRTDHLLLRTNVSLHRARTLASEAEAHIGRVLAVFGDPLDLRLPEDPLRVVVAARRAEFQALLARTIAAAVDWNAFYETSSGTVYAADEAGGGGGLPLVADLRHEMTHAILDLGRPEAGRSAMYARPQFWLWEGAALWTENLGDANGVAAGYTRFDRFRRRAVWGDVVPLGELFVLQQGAFLGRHYDETAVFMAWLLATEGGARRAGTFALLAKVMDGDAEVPDFERLVGLSVDEAEGRWKATWPQAEPASAPAARK